MRRALPQPVTVPGIDFAMKHAYCCDECTAAAHLREQEQAQFPVLMAGGQQPITDARAREARTHDL